MVKYEKISWLIIAFLIINPVCNLNSQIPTSGLIAWYPFNGNANDESGNGNNGVVYEAVLTADRCGNSNSAYYFDGEGDIIMVEHTELLNPQRISISAWISVENYTTWGRIVDKYHYNRMEGYNIIIDHGFQAIRFEFWGEDNQKYPNISNPIPLNTWIHVVSSFDGNQMKVYINGILENTIPVNTEIKPTNRYLSIGNGDDGNGYLPFNGIIDDVRIYNRALSDEEILALYNAENSCTLQPMIIMVENTICQGQQNVSCHVENMDSVWAYVWSYSGTGVTIEGEGTQVLLDFSNDAVSGILKVKGERVNAPGYDSAILHITVDPLPSAVGEISGNSLVCLGQNRQIYSVNPVNNANNYIWNFSGTGANITGNTETVIIDFTQAATSGNLTTTTMNSCGTGPVSPELSISVLSCSEFQPELLNIPNAFTPNGDGMNDVFYIRGLPEYSRLIVFERSGKEVFQSDNYQNDWDGKNLNGVILESGTYWYVLTISGFPEDFKGYIFLKR
jgi:gliding motility-associated-like protein